MNFIKKMLGIVWMILGPAIIIFLIQQAIEKIGLSPAGIDRTNTTLQWAIIILIFIPIGAGLVIFGRYAWQGEYETLPENSEDI